MAAGSRKSQLAKLSRPRLFDAFPRERLFAQLDATRDHSVVWIAAPPGAGKTTLIASYIEARRLSGVWYQMDQGDGDPATFFYYLGLAEKSMAGRRANGAALPLFTPEYLQDVPGFARRYFREFFLRLGAPAATLVLDNFQEVADHALLHEAIIPALEEVPQRTRVFVISRTEPSDRYARLSANRALIVIDWEQLKLTEPEAYGILQSVRILPNSRDMQALVERAGGWAAGLVLLVEKLRSGDLISSGVEPETLQQVFAYFAGQLFEKLAVEEQFSILRLSYLPSMSEKMAEQLTGDSNSRKLLEHLYRRHLFTDRRHGEQTMYQFHALFRTFLQHRAETDLSADQRTDTQRRAGHLLEATGEVEAAMALYIKATDIDAAQALVQERAPFLVGQGRWKVVVNWIEMLPERQVNQSAWLLHWLGTAQIGVNPPLARAILERAYAIAVEHGDVRCQVQTAAGMVEAIFLEYSIFSPIDPWIPVLERSLQPGFTFASLESELRAQSALLVAGTYRMPDHPEIDVCVSRVRELLRTGVDINLRVSAATHLTLYGTFTGHLEESRRAAALLAPLLDDPAVHIFRKIFAWAVITWYACNASDHALGDQAVAANENIARHEGIHIAERFACIIGYYLDMDRRDARSGLRRIERFEQIMIQSQPYEAASLVNMKSWHGVFTDDSALTLIQGPIAFELYSEAGSIPHILVGLNALIWGCVEGADEQAAVRWIAEHRRWSSRRNMEWASWAPDAAEALLALRGGDDAGLQDKLRKIFSSERHRLDQYGHMLAWCRRWASVLSAEALSRHIHRERVRRFISEFALDAPSRHIEAWPWRLKIYSLGLFAVVREGEPLVFSNKVPKKLLALLKCIIAFGGAEVPEEKLTDSLWPDEDGDAAHRSFTTALHRLRKLLGAHELIVQRDGKLSLDAKQVWVDALAFEDLCTQAEEMRKGGQTPAYCAVASRAISLYRGGLMDDDSGHAWTLGQRERLRGRFIDLCAGFGRHLEQQGQLEEAVALYRRGIEIDSLAEVFYAGVMRCHQKGGRIADAVGTYVRMQKEFAALLGVRPSAATEELYRSLTSS